MHRLRALVQNARQGARLASSKDFRVASAAPAHLFCCVCVAPGAAAHPFCCVCVAPGAAARPFRYFRFASAAPENRSDLLRTLSRPSLWTTALHTLYARHPRQRFGANGRTFRVSKKSKQVDNRLQSSGHVITAATTHRTEMAESLAARAIEPQGANTLVTKEVILTVFDFLTDTLGQSAQSMDEAELRLVAEKADDVGLREDRDSKTASLLAACVRVRSMVIDALGPTALKTYGLTGDTPRIPTQLASHARTVVKLLQEAPFTVTVDGVSFDSAAMASTLQAKAVAVEKTLTDAQREEQELGNELGKRDAAIDAWTERHQGVADTLVGLFRLAGRKDLSERVRPSARMLAGDEVASVEAPPVETPK